MCLAAGRVVALDGFSFRWSIAIVLCAFALGAQAQNKCSATGLMGGEKFAANNCAVAQYHGESVAIWFNEDPISAREAEDFQASAEVNDEKDGKQRTLLVIDFCPGGGAMTASAAAIKLIGLHTNHATSPFLGIPHDVVEPKFFKVGKMTGEIKAGSTLAGKIAGTNSSGKTQFTLDFEVKLPAKDASSGSGCHD